MFSWTTFISPWVMGLNFNVDTFFIEPPSQRPAKQHKDQCSNQRSKWSRKNFLKDFLTYPRKYIQSGTSRNEAQNNVKEFRKQVYKKRVFTENIKNEDNDCHSYNRHPGHPA